MTPVPFASLSLHSLVNSVGTDVAFAAIIGLAILILLYFAQARETATLRERLDDAAQWIEALESRLTQLQRSQEQAVARPPQAAPAPTGGGLLRRPGQQTAPRLGAGSAAAGASAGPSRPMRGPLVGAPAGMGAPALAAATHLIPLPGANEPAVARSGNREEETSVAAPVVAAPAAAPAAAGSASATDAAPAGEDTILAVPAPATAAALANGQGSAGAVAPPAPRPAFPPSPADSGMAAGRARGGARGSGNGGSGPPAAPLSSRSGGSRQLPPLRTAAPSQPSRARRLVPILIGLAAVVVIVVVLLIITHDNSNSTTVHKSHALSARTKHSKTAAVVPSNVTVAVLNGTSVTNLAHDVASRLGTDGYKEGTIATAADQTHSSTIVAYLPGHQADARAVAAVLNLKSGSVQSVNQQAMGVACPGASSTTTSSATTSSSSTCSADVVVTVGSDLAGLASSATG